MQGTRSLALAEVAQVVSSCLAVLTLFSLGRHRCKCSGLRPLPPTQQPQPGRRLPCQRPNRPQRRHPNGSPPPRPPQLLSWPHYLWRSAWRHGHPRVGARVHRRPCPARSSSSSQAQVSQYCLTAGEAGRAVRCNVRVLLAVTSQHRRPGDGRTPRSRWQAGMACSRLERMIRWGPKRSCSRSWGYAMDTDT